MIEFGLVGADAAPGRRARRGGAHPPAEGHLRPHPRPTISPTGCPPAEETPMPAQSIEALVDAMTLEEQVSLLSGEDIWSLPAIPRLGLGKLRVTDGPNGARGGGSLIGGVRSAAFPIGIALGATWDPELLREIGGGARRGDAVEGRPRPPRPDHQHPPLGDQRPQLRVFRRGPGADRRARRRLRRGAAGRRRRRHAQALRRQRERDPAHHDELRRSTSARCARSTSRPSRRW